MWRMLPVCALLLGPSLAVCAADAPNGGEMVYRLTVQPMAAPIPALKYQLLPELREMNPGNPIHEYTRCFAQQHNFWQTKDAVDKREKWQTMPLQDLPLQEISSAGYGRQTKSVTARPATLQEISNAGYGGRSPLRYADSAARLDTPDWQILLRLKSEGANLLLPDLQGLRELAAALKVRFRVEIAERRFDDALATAKTMLALSRHLGENPTLVGNLVGIAVGNVTLSTVDEMLQQPGCPNLFWGLTDLPYPFIDLRKGAQGERSGMIIEFALFDDHGAMSEIQLQKVVEHLDLLMKAVNVKRDVSDWLNKMAQDENHVEAARKRLIASGLAANKVKSFPARQVILLDEKLEYEVRRDNVMKGMALPFWQAKPYFRTGKFFKDERENTLFAEFTSSWSRVKYAQARLDQRIALLRCVEALRIYAAEHDGKLPAKLDDVRLPLPVDPATGKPFSYKVDGQMVHLHGDPLLIQLRYEVTIRK